MIGVDEVGRGALAGDMLSCAFAFDPEGSEGIIEEARGVAADSKSFSSRRKREAAYDLIIPAGVFVLNWGTIGEIERLNIRMATHVSMTRAVLELSSVWSERYPCLEVPRVAIDGADVPAGMPEGSFSMVRGDAIIPEIACASIIAKISRDSYMREADKKWPGYGFGRNAGYGSRAHREGISSLGMCPVHRSWAAKFTRQDQDIR